MVEEVVVVDVVVVVLEVVVGKNVKNGFLNFRIRLIIKKSQLCPIAPKFFLVGSWVIKDPTGNRMSSKRTYLSPFRSYGPKTVVFTRFWRFRLKMIVFWP